MGLTVTPSLRHHWPEYLMDGRALGTFMVSVGVFAVQLYGNSSINEALNDLTLRFLYGIVIGGTGIGIIFSMGNNPARI